METQGPQFAVGDAVLVLGTANDGKVGTILRRIQEDEYLVALEDGTQVVLHSAELSLRR
jgi:hypothetical protein